MRIYTQQQASPRDFSEEAPSSSGGYDSATTGVIVVETETVRQPTLGSSPATAAVASVTAAGRKAAAKETVTKTAAAAGTITATATSAAAATSETAATEAATVTVDLASPCHTVAVVVPQGNRNMVSQ